MKSLIVAIAAAVGYVFLAAVNVGLGCDASEALCWGNVACLLLFAASFPWAVAALGSGEL